MMSLVRFKMMDFEIRLSISFLKREVADLTLAMMNSLKQYAESRWHGLCSTPL